MATGPRHQTQLRQVLTDRSDAIPCTLSIREVMHALLNEHKRPDETYRQYAFRLINIADALPGGVDVHSNAAQALLTFVNRAYPENAKFLRTIANLQTDKPIEELHRMTRELSMLVGSDGQRKSGQGRRASSAPLPK
ncbi:hypothetical protein PF003_g25958 [Phytophthora fragariae]|nr:hypothetical protein PF003_g25958 [Phytophthora fragariae]